MRWVCDEPKPKPIQSRRVSGGKFHSSFVHGDEGDEDLIAPNRVKETDSLACDLGSVFSDFRA
jgi:hypothetical protein